MSIEQLKSNIDSIRVARKAYEEAIQRGEAEELEIKKQIADLEKKASMPREWKARIGVDGGLYPEWLCAPHGSSAITTVREVKPIVVTKLSAEKVYAVHVRHDFIFSKYSVAEMLKACGAEAVADE